MHVLVSPSSHRACRVTLRMGLAGHVHRGLHEVAGLDDLTHAPHQVHHRSPLASLCYRVNASVRVGSCWFHTCRGLPMPADCRPGPEPQKWRCIPSPVRRKMSKY